MAPAPQLALFSQRDNVPEHTRDAYLQLRDNLLTELKPVTQLEQILVHEIISASWRLERCAQIEANPESEAVPSLDRARNSAFRILNRALKELRTLQTHRIAAEETGLDIPPSASVKEVIQITRANQAAQQTRTDNAIDNYIYGFSDAPLKLQNEPNTPRTAPCPCGSGRKYKRCCGVTAPPVLSARAA